MANLARPIHRPLPAQTNASRGGKTKVLLLRQPIKSVRRDDELSHRGFRLSLGVVVGGGIVACVWLMGHLGFRLGFAPAIGVPDLLGDPGGGLATGAMIVLGYPARILEAGVAEPMWLMLAFALMLIPAGGLAGAKPQIKGGPRPSQLFVVMSWTGAVSAALLAAAYIAYFVSPFRLAWTTPLPAQLRGVDQWLSGWTMAAALDGLALIGAALWVVLVFRVTVPAWMKAIAASACLFAAAAGLVAAGISGATVAHLHLPRPVVTVPDISPQPALLIGQTRTHSIIMQPDSPDAAATMRMTAFDYPSIVQISDRKSIATLLLENLPEDFE